MEGTMTERIHVNGLPAEASLSAGGDLWWRVDGGAGGGEQSLTVESSVLGFTAEGREITVRAFVSQLKGPFCGVGNLGNMVMKEFVLEMSTEAVARMWSEWLRKYIDSLGRPTSIFIILNPYGGKKSARKIFHTEIRPLLLAANITYTLQETEYQLHAQELAYKLDFLKYDGIVCVSGDGVLVEVINGLLQREDWDTAIKVPLGIIPAGTGNGLAKSILDAVGENYTIQNATLAVIRGHKRALDVTTVLQGKTRFFSILMLSWGLIADIDIESEKYRWMGDTRLDFYFGTDDISGFVNYCLKFIPDQGDGLIVNISVDQCILRVMMLRKYNGYIEFVPAPGHESFGKPKNESEIIAGNIEISKQGRDEDSDVLNGYQGPNCCFEDSVWRFLEGPFISIMLVNVPWVGKDAMPAPEAKFSDGFLDLVLIKDCPKSALASILLKTGDGSHVKSPYVMYLKVKAFRLVPGNRVGDSAKGGIIDVDGEVVARGEGVYMCGQERDPMSYGPPILLTVDKGLATIFSSR